MSEITAHHGLFKDTHLHVDDSGGAGRPVLLAHAWPLSGQAWSLQVPALLGAGYRAVTFDRRGFGRSDKPLTGYTYDALTRDLHTLIEALDLHEVTIVGYSMGGGEVARYCSSYGTERLHSVVFASAVTPYMLHTRDNPEGPLAPKDAESLVASFHKDTDAFYVQQMTEFFSANGELKATEAQRQAALTMCRQAGQAAVLECMIAWGASDFRGDLAQVSVPAMVIHGDADASVPIDGSARRTHRAIPGSELHVIAGGPHCCNISHADDFNQALLDFLAR